MNLLSIFSFNLLSEDLLLFSSILIFVAVMVSKLGSKFGVPSLFLFLLVGMAAGEDGLGLQFDEYEIAESIGHFAMTIILFTAGLQTSMEETKPVFKKGVLLSSLGVLLTVTLTGFFIYFVFGGSAGITLLACFLLASIMGSTDSASVFSVLRSKKLHLRENLGELLELESGSNDPMALTLTVISVKLITTPEIQDESGAVVLSAALIVLALQVVVGILVGVGVGFAAKSILNKIELPNFALYSVLMLSIGFFANGVSSLLHGNGLLSLYIAAIIIGNKVKLPRRKEVISFFDGITWLMQLVMFLMLGLLANPSDMPSIILPALLIGAFLMFVARPLSIFICLLPFRGLTTRAKLFTSWVGLKGAGPILFALCPVVAGVDRGDDMFNMVFVITLFSLLVQGSSIPAAARALKLCYDEDPKVETFGMDLPEEMGMLRDHTVTEADVEFTPTLREMGLPHGIRVVMVRRENKFLVPHGSMKLQAGDHLIIVMGESDD